MKIKLNRMPMKYSHGKLKLIFSVPAKKIENLTYAYYIYQDGKAIQKIWYQPVETVTTIQVEPLFSGAYQLRLFVKEGDTIIYNELTETLNIDCKNKALLTTTLAEEKIFFNDVPVKYLFQPAEGESDTLVLSFSGLYSTEFQGGPPVYNHIRTLEPVNAHKLFLLDSYQEQFCYYVGFNREHDFERAVIALITKIANQYNISAKRIIATGSSKGGAAALYYSVKYNFGKAIIGAPQIYIADYLNKRANSPSMRERYERLLGENQQQGQRFWNQLILHEVAVAEKFPDMYFHVGEGDFHYPQHLAPLLQQLDKRGVAYQLDLESYENHSDTGLYFAPFLLRTIQALVRK